MAIFIDSAKIDEIKEALSLGYVKGVTTNPLLMAKTDGPWREKLRDICKLSKGPVYYQIDENDEDKLIDAARSIYNISPGQIILKLPATPPYLKVVTAVGHIVPCCITAVYSESQLIAAAEAGAKHIAVYVNRISRFFKEGKGNLTSDGPQTILSMRELIDRRNFNLEILAASLKNPDEVVSAVKNGAHHATTTIEVLKKLGSHSLSDEATEEFKKACENKY